jgi:hypothetical protein
MPATAIFARHSLGSSVVRPLHVVAWLASEGGSPEAAKPPPVLVYSKHAKDLNTRAVRDNWAVMVARCVSRTRLMAPIEESENPPSRSQVVE